MNCNEIIPLLSPYHDGELSDAQHRLVDEHVSRCASCARKLESLRKLSGLVDQACSPVAPTSLLPRIEASLAASNAHAQNWRSLVASRKVVMLLVATAAAVLAGVFIWRLAGEHSHSHAEMVKVFGQFLEEYEQRPHVAVDLLSQRYDGAIIDEPQATLALKRPTAARERLLSDHQVVKRCLLKMPCCDCVQTTYARNGQVTFVVFEHEREEMQWFAERPAVRAQCQGKPCCLVELKQGVAATWPVSSGYVTVVGIRDMDELDQLVHELQPL